MAVFTLSIVSELGNSLKLLSKTWLFYYLNENFSRLPYYLCQETAVVRILYCALHEKIKLIFIFAGRPVNVYVDLYIVDIGEISVTNMVGIWNFFF